MTYCRGTSKKLQCSSCHKKKQRKKGEIMQAVNQKRAICPECGRPAILFDGEELPLPLDEACKQAMITCSLCNGSMELIPIGIGEAGYFYCLSCGHFEEA
ncbi:MAG: hypothetical protein HY731_04365 [Candidatus Tectomicrobia bacterium]|nr:hypothetical protein [Candidatus Tectomicrobia bacterium]